MTAARTIKKGSVKLLLQFPYFASLALRLKPVEDSRCPTMGTDGRVLAYNPDFVAKLSDSELIYILAHECLHCVLQHLWRRGTRIHALFNIATDEAINTMLHYECGMENPKTIEVYCHKEYVGMSAEEIYDLLEKNVTYVQLDSHDMWEDGHDGTDGDEEKDGSGGENSTSVSKKSRDELKADWELATQQMVESMKSQGKLPASLERLISISTKQRVDWRLLLRYLMTNRSKSDYTFFPPNRRHVWRGIYLPSTKSETMDIAVAIDTSGSVGNKELSEFLGELESIRTSVPCTVWVIYCDAAVHNTQRLEEYDLIDTSLVKGGGGTDFRSAFTYLADNDIIPDVLVYITDLMGTFPEETPPYPVIWATTSSCDNPPFGEVIRIAG